MVAPAPRPYQAGLIQDIYGAWARGTRDVLGVLPTGGGKSVVVSNIAQNDARDTGQKAVIAHRQELVGQLSLHVARAEVPHRILAPRNVVAFISALHRREFGCSFVNPDAATTVAGVDTLVARKDELAQWSKQVTRWTIDEAHHVLRANKWGTAVEMFPNGWGLGVTASPKRADGRGLGIHADGVFGEMVEGPTMRELINMGALTEYQIAVAASDFNVEALQITDSGDFSPKQAREAAHASHIVGDVVEEYIKLAFGLPGITFATDVETAVDMASQFNARGIPAAAVSAKTPDNIRADLIDRFRQGTLKQLVNVDLFGEGFDLPALGVVSMARPTASLSVYLQQFGRVLRPSPGKEFGLVIDHVSNWKRHGVPDRKRLWSLDSVDKRSKKHTDPDEIPVKECQSCHRGYEAIFRKCPHCGFQPVPQGGGRSIEQVEGDMFLLDVAMLTELRNSIILPTVEKVASQAAYLKGPGIGRLVGERHAEKIKAQGVLQDAIAIWAGYERAKGRDDAEIYRRFYHATGTDVLTAQTMDRKEMEVLASEVLGWLTR